MKLSFELVLGLLVLVLAVNSQENEYGLVVSLYPKGLIYRRDGSSLRIRCDASANRADLEISLYKDKKRIRHLVNTFNEDEVNLAGRISLVYEVAEINEFDIAKYTCRAYVDAKAHYEDVSLTVDSAEYDNDCGGPGCDNRCINDTTTTRRTTTTTRRIVIPTAVPVAECYDFETYDDQLRCEPTQKLCKGRGGTEVKCVEKSWFCDGENDCADGSDEDNCPPNRGSQKVCRSTQFLCKNGNQCISKAYVCDRNRDCEDNSDEEGCVKPQVVSPPVRTLDVCVGETIILRCAASGFPIPYVNWRLNWGHICPTSRCCVENEDGYGVLTIRNAVVSDSGAYSCETINNQGREFHPVDAIVSVRECQATLAPAIQCYQYGTRSQTNTECYCFDGYEGVYCRDCSSGYERDASGRCIRRTTQRPSLNCDVFGTRYGSPDACYCKDGYTGYLCGECVSGYRRDRYGRECVIVIPDVVCNPRGTRGGRAVDGKCICLPGYSGDICDRCDRNAYTHQISGECIPCFCNGLDVNCRGASNLYYNREIQEFKHALHDWSVVELPGNEVSKDVYTDGRRGLYEFTGSSGSFFFNVGSFYKGNRTGSYGGELSFKILYRNDDDSTNVRGENDGRLEIRIQGTKVALVYKHPEQLLPNREYMITIKVVESNFQRYPDGGAVSKEHMIMALHNVELILISASFSDNQNYAAISRFSLDRAKECMDPSRGGYQERAHLVEICECPYNYNATSCDGCSYGYNIVNKGFYLGVCEEEVLDCSSLCHGHSDSCDASMCYNCADNTTGKFCDRCLPGYVGNAKAGPCFERS